MKPDDSLIGLLYLYNGGEQPEIWSVDSVRQVLQYAAAFKSARLEQPGKPPVWIRPKKLQASKVDPEAPDENYDWRKARGLLRSGEPEVRVDLPGREFSF